MLRAGSTGDLLCTRRERRLLRRGWDELRLRRVMIINLLERC
jgi:hypothetical protein